MITFVRQLSTLIDPAGYRKVALVFCLTLVTAIFEVAGIASIMPFITVMSQPDVMQNHALLKQLYRAFGFVNLDQFSVFLGTCAFVLLVLMNAFNTVAQWVTVRFTFMQGDYISRRLFAHYLNKPYAYFVNRHSSDMAKEIQSESRDLVEGVLSLFVVVCVKSVISLFIFAFLVWVDPVLAIIMFGLLASAYGVVYLLVHKRLRRIGEIRSVNLGLRYKIAAEAFTAIKEVKLSASEANFVSQYQRPSAAYARAHAMQNIISELPRYAVETAAFAGIVVIVLYLILTRGSFGTALPVLAVYALAAQRLLPAMQRIFNGVTSIRSYGPVLARISAELATETAAVAPPDATVTVQDTPLPLRDSITVDHVTFTYKGANAPVFDDLSVRIRANDTVGLVGPTGSGKTTVVDLIMGLLHPNEGQILVDGQPLAAANVEAWQSNFGYVPQQIHLLDDSVARNIAFGVFAEDIDMTAVEHAARVANIHEFVVHELPRGYDTLIGENGVRLSGGQRQRLGIARALYNDPAILVLDEATSALDDETEAAIIDAIANLKHRKTILIVAHRPGTVACCDEIIEIRQGRTSRRSRADEPFDRSDSARSRSSVRL